MSKVFHTADWHFGHKNILKYREDFTTIEEHDNTIIENYMKTITRRDTVYFHGDIVFHKDYLPIIQELPGYKILVVGNHDTDFLRLEDFFGVFDRIYALTSKKKAWLSHAPIHPEELRGKINIHGHVHAQTLPDDRYFNVSLENTNYTPIDRQEINKIIQERKDRNEQNLNNI